MSNMSNADYFAKNIDDVESEEIYSGCIAEKNNIISKKPRIVSNINPIIIANYVKYKIQNTKYKIQNTKYKIQNIFIK